jgi:hypothetical protein
VAVATDMEGFATLSETIPALVFRAVAMFLGMVCIGLGQRMKQQTA